MLNLGYSSSILIQQDVNIDKISETVSTQVEIINNSLAWNPFYNNGVIEFVNVSVDITFYEELFYVPVLFIVDENETMVDLNHTVLLQNSAFLPSEVVTPTIGDNKLITGININGKLQLWWLLNLTDCKSKITISVYRNNLN